MPEGVVKFFKDEKGWGPVTVPGLPEVPDVFVMFFMIETTGYRTLSAGDVVDIDFEPRSQDSFEYVGTRVRVLRAGPAPTLRRGGERVMVESDETPDTPLTSRSTPAA